MRIFRNFKEYIREMPREVFSRGTDVMDKTVQGKIVTRSGGYEQKELYGVSFTINDLSDADEMMKIAKQLFKKEHLTSSIAKLWFKEMITNPTTKEKWWNQTKYTKNYFKNFCDEGNGFSSYGYGERIIPQLNDVIKRLKTNLYSRGAYIAIHDSRDIHRIGRRIPCTLSYGFSVRNTLNGPRINLFLHQRSQDLINFASLDLYKATLLLNYVGKKIKVKPGKLIVYVDSLHSYHKDVPDNIKW